MTRKKLLILLGSVCLALMLVAMACAGPAPTPTPTPSPSPTVTPVPTPAPTEEVYNWRFASWATPAVASGYKWHPAFCERVGEMSGGRINVEFVSAAVTGALGPFDAISSGVTELGIPCLVEFYDVMEEGKLMYLPFSFRKVEEPLTIFYAKGYEELLREAYLELDPPLQLLAPEVWPTALTMVNTPVTSLDDLRKLKIRARGTTADFLNLLGITTVVIAQAEVYVGLATGTCDGAVGFVADEMYDMKVYEFAKYMVEPPFFPCMAGAHYVCNMDAWNTLTEDLQAIILVAAREASLVSALGGQTLDNEYRKKLMDEGCTRCVIEGAEDNALMAEKSKEMWDVVRALSPRNAEMMDIFEDYMRELGYI